MKIAIILIFGLLFAWGCGGAKMSAAALTELSPDTVIEGTLVDARGYITLSSVDDGYAYASFQNAESNLPLGIVTAEKQFYIIDIPPKRIASFVTQKVKVTGTVHKKTNIIQPDTIEFYYAATALETIYDAEDGW
jgi:hypothetical protein